MKPPPNLPNRTSMEWQETSLWISIYFLPDRCLPLCSFTHHTFLPIIITFLGFLREVTLQKRTNLLLQMKNWFLGLAYSYYCSWRFKQYSATVDTFILVLAESLVTTSYANTAHELGHRLAAWSACCSVQIHSLYGHVYPTCRCPTGSRHNEWMNNRCGPLYMRRARAEQLIAWASHVTWAQLVYFSLLLGSQNAAATGAKLDYVGLCVNCLRLRVWCNILYLWAIVVSADVFITSLSSFIVTVDTY